MIGALARRQYVDQTKRQGMAESDIEKRVKEIIAKEINADPSQIKRESTLEDAQIESIDLVQIMFAIEEEFDIYLADEDIGFDVENVGVVIDAVERLVAKKNDDAGGS